MLPLGVLVLFFTLFLAGGAGAADYYVSTSGSDSNLGTDPNNPWEHIPFSADAESYADSYIPSPGDNILLKRGDTWILSSYINRH